MNNPLQLGLVSFKKGSYITVEGKNSDQFYIIRSGNVHCGKEFEIEEETGGEVFKPGDFFGVVSTMSSHNHLETARALSDVTLISVNREQYPLLIERNTQVAMKIINVFSRKVRMLDQALTRMTFKNAAEIEPPHLFQVAEYYIKQNQYNQAYYSYYQYLKHCPQGDNVKIARAKMDKIKPYATVAYLDVEKSSEFIRQYPRDTMVFSEGEFGPELYIIQKGSIRITKIVDNNEVMLALLKPGDIFGEMALLENKPRSASAIAHEDSVLMAVNRTNFKSMVVEQPKIISRLTILLAERIWSIYKQLENTMISDPAGRMWDTLLLELEKNRIDSNMKRSYSYPYGPKELINIVGLTKEVGAVSLRKLMENKKFKVVDNKFFIDDIREVKKNADYFKTMEKLNRSRQAGRQQV